MELEAGCAPHVLDLALDAPLLTRDRRLAEVPGHGARVEVVGVS
jgi:hypothetical protein